MADGAKDSTKIHKQDPGVCPWVDEVVQDEVQSQIHCVICQLVCPDTQTARGPAGGL